MHHHRDGGFLAQANCGLDVLLIGVSVPLIHFFGLASGTLFGLPASLVFDRLFFQVIDGFVYRDAHVFRLRQPDQRPLGRINGDFGFMTVFFDGEDNFGFELITKNFADFCEAGFYFFADRGSDFVVSSGVLHVHERPS